MLRTFLIAAVVVWGVARILAAEAAHHPFTTWALWPVLGYWLAALYMTWGCLGLGLRSLRVIGSDGYSPAERGVVGFALGVLGFALLVVLGGCVGILTTTFSLLLPALCGFAYGAKGWRGLLQQAREVRAASEARPFDPLTVAALALSVLVLAAVYIPTLSLHNIQHDARWYHLPIAAQYAAQQDLEPFAEGWFLSAYPHLSSYLYTWALLLPTSVAHRLGVAAHMEFLLFLATAASVPVLVARLMPGSRMGLSWAVFFLFPGYLTYDSNLSLGADHVAALWAAPLMIVLLQLWRSLSGRDAGLLGALCAAAAGTKYSAVCLVAPVAIGVVVASGRAALAGAGRSQRARRALALASVFGVAFLGLWSPHWVKNWLWYGDPLYPLLHSFLSIHPWNPTADRMVADFHQHQVEHGARTLKGLLEGLRYGASYGFETKEYGFHGQRPVFGFLYAAMLPALPLLRLKGRVWAAAGLSLLGTATWYLTYTRDRYMQALLPWLVAVAAVGLRACWRSESRLLRGCVALLVMTQLAMGADVFFLRSHMMADGKHPLDDIMARVTAGFTNPQSDPSKPHQSWGMASWVDLGRALPEGAKLLVHRQRLWLGVDVPVVTDESAWQAGIDYDRLGSGQALYERLRKWGVTHVVTGDYPHNRELGPDTVGGELVLWDLLHESQPVPWAGPWGLWRLPKALPMGGPPSKVSWQTCKTHDRANGVYLLSQLGADPTTQLPEPEPKNAHETRRDMPRFAVTEKGCRRPPKEYTSIAERGDLRLWWTYGTTVP